LICTGETYQNVAERVPCPWLIELKGVRRTSRSAVPAFWIIVIFQVCTATAVAASDCVAALLVIAAVWPFPARERAH